MSSSESDGLEDETRAAGTEAANDTQDADAPKLYTPKGPEKMLPLFLDDPEGDDLPPADPFAYDDDGAILVL